MLSPNNESPEKKNEKSSILMPAPVLFPGPVVMDMSGYSEKGFKRKLAVQALFGKVFYLSEVSFFTFMVPFSFYNVALFNIFAVTRCFPSVVAFALYFMADQGAYIRCLPLHVIKSLPSVKSLAMIPFVLDWFWKFFSISWNSCQSSVTRIAPWLLKKSLGLQSKLLLSILFLYLRQ